MGVLSALVGPAPRQVSLWFRVEPATAERELPEGLRAARCGPWAMVELACAVPPIETVGAEVALLAWRLPVERADGAVGMWVLDRWTSARLGSGWPDRWVAQRLSSERGERHASWEEEVGLLTVDVCAGPRRLGFSSSPTDRPTRSVFLTARQAERFLETFSGVLNPHPLGRLLDRVGLSSGSQSLQPLALHRLDVTPPEGLCRAEAGVLRREALGALEFDSAYRLTHLRRVHAPHALPDAVRRRAHDPSPTPLASVSRPQGG